MNRVVSPAFRMARSQSLRSAVKETSIAMYLVSVPSVASITRSAFLKLRPMSLGRAFPDMSLRSVALRIRTNSRPMSDATPWASWMARVLAKSPLRVPVSPSMRSMRTSRLVVRVFCSWTRFSTFSRRLLCS